MIASSVVQEIRQLLAGGELSRRKIARRTGVSPSTVGAIARGQRRDARDRPAEFVIPHGPLVRCPNCGGLVQMPCLACAVRAMRRRGGRS